MPTLIRQVLLPLLLPSLLGAFELSDTIRIDGFATVGASTVLEEAQEFRAYTFQRDGVRRGEINLQNNTLMGLQGEVQATDALSATVQGVLLNTAENVYELKADWAYLSYVIDQDLVLRAGKFRLPLFNSSELTYVGYARSWVRPALPFYGVAGLSHYTGGNLRYTLQDERVQWGFEAGFGVGHEETVNASNRRNTFESNDIFIARATADDNTYHAGLTYYRADTHIQLNTPSKQTDTTTLAQMLAAEAELYLGPVTLQAGAGYGWTQRVLPNELLAYGGASYQIEKWRPFLLYSDKSFDHKKVVQPTPPPGAPAPRPQPTYVSEQTFSAGVRYDVADFADIKFQLDHILGMKYNSQLLLSDNINDRRGTVLTLVLDVVF